MNVGQQSWSSFHHKYGSDDFRKSTDFDRVSRAPGVVRSLLLKKQSSSRNLPVEEKVRPGISRCSSTLNIKSSSKCKSLSLHLKHSQTSMSSERLMMSRRSSLSTISCSSQSQQISDTSVSKNRNASFQ